ncbi:MAG: hypothetical protein RLZZ282_699 [Verrucomicrobiota bacterium]
MPHARRMQKFFWLPFSAAVVLFLTGCANNGGLSGNDPVGTGPFDSAGNYREEWANDPSKWRKPGTRSQAAVSTDDVAVIAKNDQPPPNANPLDASSAATQKMPVAKSASQPREVARRTGKSKSDDTRTTAHESPRASDRKPSTKSGKSGKSKEVKQVAKAKSKSGRYVVKQGDNLSGIASRNRSSVAAIQKANGMSGTFLRAGQTLTIPKR